MYHTFTARPPPTFRISWLSAATRSVNTSGLPAVSFSPDSCCHCATVSCHCASVGIAPMRTTISPHNGTSAPSRARDSLGVRKTEKTPHTSNSDRVTVKTYFPGCFNIQRNKFMPAPSLPESFDTDKPALGEHRLPPRLGELARRSDLRGALGIKERRQRTLAAFPGDAQTLSGDAIELTEHRPNRPPRLRTGIRLERPHQDVADDLPSLQIFLRLLGFSLL